MSTLSEARIEALLAPFLMSAAGAEQFPVPPTLYSQLATYLDVLLRWNLRTNLTAVREPEDIVRRHFGESLFAGIHLAPLLAESRSLLDFGSGAGFPGLPIQVLLPDADITLAESQGKKAAFLREAVRTLGLGTKVWGGRVEDLEAGKLFHIVTLRAVDNMEAARKVAAVRLRPGGCMAVLEGTNVPPQSHVVPTHSFVLPGQTGGRLVLYGYDVPRGT